MKFYKYVICLKNSSLWFRCKCTMSAVKVMEPPGTRHKENFVKPKQQVQEYVK